MKTALLGYCRFASAVAIGLAVHGVLGAPPPGVPPAEAATSPASATAPKPDRVTLASYVKRQANAALDAAGKDGDFNAAVTSLQGLFDQLRSIRAIHNSENDENHGPAEDVCVHTSGNNGQRRRAMEQGEMRSIEPKGGGKRRRPRRNHPRVHPTLPPATIRRVRERVRNALAAGEERASFSGELARCVDLADGNDKRLRHAARQQLAVIDMRVELLRSELPGSPVARDVAADVLRATSAIAAMPARG